MKREFQEAREFIKSAKKLLNDENFSPQEVFSFLVPENIIFVQVAQSLRGKRFVNWCLANILQATRSTNYYENDLSSTEKLKKLVDSLSNLYLFSQLSPVVFNDLEKLKKNQFLDLGRSLKNRPPGVPLFLISQRTKEDNKLFAKEINCKMLVISPFSNSELKKYLAMEACREGAKGLNDKAAHLLIERCGDSLVLLSNEIRRLVLLVDKGEIISEDLVKEHVFPKPEHNINLLLTHIVNKRPIKAEETIFQLLESGFHPLQIISWLSKSARIISAIGENKTIPSSSELGSAWLVRKLTPIAVKIRNPDLLVKKICKLDLDLKEASTLNAKMLFSHFLQSCQTELLIEKEV